MSNLSSESRNVSVTVIVPTYNRANFIGESLDAILPQLGPHDELIVVNDGSKDDTLSVLAGYGDRLKVITQENAGKSAALNRALREATGDMIWIVDDDDIVAEDARARLVGALEAKPEAGFAYGRHDRFIDHKANGKRQFLDTGYWFECPPEAFLCATLEDFFAHQPGMMVRKSIYDETGPFSEVYSEDYDMLIRLAMISRPVAVPGILFHQRQHEGLRGSAAAPIKIQERDKAWIQSGQAILLKYMDELPLAFFLPDRTLSDEKARRRAHLQRGVIFGRHGFWQEAALAFEAALQETTDPLEAADREVLQRISHSKFGAQSILRDGEGFKALMRLSDKGRAGRALLRIIGRSFVWHARKAYRQRKWAVAFGFAKKIFRLWVLAR